MKHRARALKRTLVQNKDIKLRKLILIQKNPINFQLNTNWKASNKRRKIPFSTLEQQKAHS